MDANDWRLELVTRYNRAFEVGDLAEIDAVLAPNFHEQLEGRDEIDRLGQLDHLRRLIGASVNRNAELSNFVEHNRDVSAHLRMRFDIDAQTWTMTANLRFRFDDAAIDHVTVWNADIRSVESLRDEKARR